MAPYSLNISGQNRRFLLLCYQKAKLDELSNLKTEHQMTLFDDALRDIQANLFDSLGRFLISSAFTSLDFQSPTANV